MKYESCYVARLGSTATPGVQSVVLKRGLAAGLCTLAFYALPVSAHHSFAMFDGVKESVLKGVVSKFEWTNPHTWLELDVPDDNGVLQHWSIEGGSVLGLARQGWKRTTLQPGDKISVVIHPLRSGEHGGSLMGVITADGRTLGVPLTPEEKKAG